jgi:pyruvate formate-lyase/glycerol dehydratase family glycyl radical enzyme
LEKLHYYAKRLIREKKMVIRQKERTLVHKLEGKRVGGFSLRVRKASQRVCDAVPTICIERAKIMTEVFMKTEGEPTVIRRAKAFKELCERGTIFIQDDELIVGQPGSKIRAAIFNPETQCWILSGELDTISTRKHDPFLITDDQKRLFKEFVEPYWRGKSSQRDLISTAPEELCQLEEALVIGLVGLGLSVQNHELVIKLGFNGIKKRINEKLASLDAAIPGDHERIVYLNALLIVCDGIENYAGRYARLSKEKACEENDPQRKAELEEIAEICQRVPTNQATTFWEALQSLWFYQVFAVMASPATGGGFRFTPGRMDQYLYPYFKNDIEQGRLTKEQAQELLECLWVKFSEPNALSDQNYASFVPGYSTFQQVCCGGVTASGQDGVNELSYMMLQAAMDVRLPQPNLSVKYNRKNPDSFLHKAADLTALGMGHPQFYNDEVGIKYVMDLGVPFEDAYNWSPAGCKDVGLAGKLGGVRIPVCANMAASVELALLNGVHRLTGARLPVPQTGDPSDFETYEEFEEAVKTQLAHQIKKASELALIYEARIREQRQDLLTSLSYEECIENAKDCMSGGAKYTPAPEIVLIGHADIVDSLASIKKLIYDDKKLTWGQLLEALDNDFEGYERIRQICLAAPKYGNDYLEVDEIATKITYFSAKEIRSYRGINGNRRVPSGVAAAWHVAHGVQVGALPSGRKAWMPLADGISPMQGTDIKGPTAVLQSVAKSCLDLHCSSLLNMKLDPSLFGDQRGIRDFVGLIKSWHDLAVYHVQFNVVSPEMLREAQEYPDRYRDLMVRVSGYCAYFVDLYRLIQDDIIARTTLAMSNR